jgi:lipoprotein-anchoring transpeptidase ErfK/SrfK
VFAQKALIIIMVCLFSIGSNMEVSRAEPVEDTVSILIRKKSRTLTIYVNETPMYTFPVATGKGELTPEGEFKIANKIINPWYMRKKIPGGSSNNPLGTRWLGLDVPNTGGYKYGIHGTNNPYSIGHNVTSGCIRLRKRDVEWLFRHVPIGTKVTIVE